MNEKVKDLDIGYQRVKDALVPRKLSRPEIRPIVPLTVDEEAYLVREMTVAPWKRMTRQEIEEQYPGALDR